MSNTKVFQLISDFETNINQDFKNLMAEYGFRKERMRLHSDGAYMFFRRDDQFVYIALNAHFRDGPPMVIISLGLGPSSELEWNAVYLAEYLESLGKNRVPYFYEIKKFSNIKVCMETMARDLERTAQSFLKGETLPLIKSISERAKKLQPFHVYKPGSNGQYESSVEMNSLERINYYKNLYKNTLKKLEEGG